MRASLSAPLAILLAAAAAACSAGPGDASGSQTGESTSAIESDSDVQAAASVNSDGKHEALFGQLLFDHDTFRGNDRTCSTCHTASAGTLNPAQIAERPRFDPIFRSIDSDDGVGNSYDRLRAHATIRIQIPLAPNVHLADDLSATSIVVNRGIPTTFNTPALDPTLMSDGREPNLTSQATDAINSHFQPGRQPSSLELSAIVAYEDTLFSDKNLAAYAAGGAAPTLPEGHTDAEKRGRLFFSEPAPKGICGFCHGGPLMNTVISPFRGSHDHFSFVLAGEGAAFDVPADQQINESRSYIISNPDGSACVQQGLCGLVRGQCVTAPVEGCKVLSTDPGRAALTGQLPDLDVFKIPVLWNIKNTAPYFHNNSAPTLEAVLDHYQAFFNSNLSHFVVAPGYNFTLTDQDKSDIVAFLKTL